jgi:hypothetical protein
LRWGLPWVDVSAKAVAEGELTLGKAPAISPPARANCYVVPGTDREQCNAGEWIPVLPRARETLEDGFPRRLPPRN